MKASSSLQRIAALVLVFASSGLAGCPKKPLAPPPVVASGPAAKLIASRDAQLGVVRADSVIRMRIPEGMEGAPGGKVHAQVLAASRPDRARLEILTPLGTPGATILLAEGMLQVYQPLPNALLKGSLDSPELEKRSPLPVPLKSLAPLLRGAVPLEDGEITERDETPPVLVSGTAGNPMRVVEVNRGGRVVQRVTVDAAGGYPVEDVRFDGTGTATLTVQYLDYGGVETDGGLVAFPQKVKAMVVREGRTATLEISLSNIRVNPILDADAFTLTFTRPPREESL